ncbi:Putative RNA polymerase ECF-subfamily sigma factor [[Actinomadura] parvosata subsp. kistnae]|uniref:RNA polymerase n=1 Tax=[Actinomadura] parvosata subsp. kistnae TaxID=1909395 RepID=A0A1V0AJD8_9ACTN|nr:sigma-70 family RNA polymerase sigma factor [Nonomuraea sp. ATCC 55076]AQZ70328.1 RNA polymerase [Nonomuraea sp. ATCC 55076]SPL95851.1 Putative RNA polymerase ECF-subfamily sigma factor [Actinomadura parvosata subsp. kistnae]
MPNPHERFTALYTTYQARVYGYAASRAGHQLAEEVVSETFLVAWRRLDDIPADAQLPWLLRVARNILRDNYRQAARRESLEAELRTWTEQAIADAGEHAVERVAVLRALAGLSDADKEVLTLTTWHGLSAAEAAEVVGCSKAAFFVRLHRARRRLQSAIDVTRTSASPKPVTVPGGELR